MAPLFANGILVPKSFESAPILDVDGFWLGVWMCNWYLIVERDAHSDAGHIAPHRHKS
jgi:hypothetical protein